MQGLYGKPQTGLRTISAGIPYTLITLTLSQLGHARRGLCVTRIGAIRFPTFGLLLYGSRRAEGFRIL